MDFKAYYFPELPLSACTPDYICRKRDGKRQFISKACLEIVDSIREEGLRDPILGVIKDSRGDSSLCWEVAGGERRWMACSLLGFKQARFILRYDKEFWEHPEFGAVLSFEHEKVDMERALELCLTEGDKVPTKIILKRWWRDLAG